MYFNYGPQSVALLILMVNLVVLSGIHCFRSWRAARMADRWMGLFLFLSACYLVPWTCGHANWYAQDGYREFLFFVPFHQYFLFGPVIFILTASLTGGNPFRCRKEGVYFLPALIYLLYSAVVAVTDLLLLDEFYFYRDGFDKDLKFGYQLGGSLYMAVFTYSSFRIYKSYRERIYRDLSYADEVSMRWLQQFLLIMLLIIALRWLVTLSLKEVGDYGLKWWYYLLFGMLSVYLGFSNLMNSARLSSWNALHLTATPENPVRPEIALPAAPQELVDLYRRIGQAMESEQLYLDPALTLSGLARRLGSNSTLVSRAINTEGGSNFNDFVNGYRVRRVQWAIEEGEHRAKTLTGLAQEAGFNSKSTFLRAFKKATGKTASEYQKGLGNNK